MKLLIKGKVQKVGFRYSVINYVHTENLPIVGHVKNLPDGSVQVIAQGDIESLKDLHRFCSKGPPKAEVREIIQEIEPIIQKDFKDFFLSND